MRIDLDAGRFKIQDLENEMEAQRVSHRLVRCLGNASSV